MHESDGLGLIFPKDFLQFNLNSNITEAEETSYNTTERSHRQ